MIHLFFLHGQVVFHAWNQQKGISRYTGTLRSYEYEAFYENKAMCETGTHEKLNSGVIKTSCMMVKA